MRRQNPLNEITALTTALVATCLLPLGCRQSPSELESTAGASTARASSTASASSVAVPLGTAPGQFSNAGKVRVGRTGFTLTETGIHGAVMAGGETAQFEPTGDVDIFDAKTGTWRPGAPLATPRHQHRSTRLNDGSLFISGGIGAGHQRLDQVERWPPGTTAAPPPPLNHPRSNHGQVMLDDGSILVVGGRGSDDRCLKSVERYDPKSNRWSLREPLAKPTCEPKLLQLTPGRVHAFGGQARHALRGLAVYDQKTNSWTLPASPGARRISYGIAMIGKMQVVLSAGDGKNGPLASNELFHAGKQAFRYLSPLPGPRSGHTFTALGDDRILLTGGSTPSTTPDDEALIFTLSDNTWRRLPALPQPRSGHAAVLLRDGRVLIAGGWTKGPKPKPYRSTALFAPDRTRDK